MVRQMLTDRATDLVYGYDRPRYSHTYLYIGRMQSSLARWTCLRHGDVLHSLFVAVVVGACSQPDLYDSPEVRNVTHMRLKLGLPDNFSLLVAAWYVYAPCHHRILPRCGLIIPSRMFSTFRCSQPFSFTPTHNARYTARELGDACHRYTNFKPP